MQVETTEKNEALTSKMQEHANLVHEKDQLEQQLLEVRKELEAAYRTIANQVNWRHYYFPNKTAITVKHAKYKGIAGSIIFLLSTLSAQLVPSEIDGR